MCHILVTRASAAGLASAIRWHVRPGSVKRDNLVHDAYAKVYYVQMSITAGITAVDLPYFMKKLPKIKGISRNILRARICDRVLTMPTILDTVV
jgi:hypothetical protein